MDGIYVASMVLFDDEGKINKEERNLVEVKSGGIENTEINDSIVTILEGTMLSFRKRDEKYIDK